MVGTRLKKKLRQVWKQSKIKLHLQKKRCDKYLIFRGSEENYINYGAWVLEESIKLFHGKANPLRHFSVDELNNMNVERQPYCETSYNYLYRGSWKGTVVMVKMVNPRGIQDEINILHEIVVATQIVTHNNAHKILGCCLETDHPVLVYEWVGHYETLEDYILVRDENGQKKLELEWKDRLRIAWEISHAVAYLHSAFPLPILHLDVSPRNVFLDLENTARLSDFGFSISIPEGKESVTGTAGISGYVAPECYGSEYLQDGKVAESTDVYAFGMLFITLLIGDDIGYRMRMTESVKKRLEYDIKKKLMSNIVDSAIIRSTVSVSTIEDLQLRASIELVNRCITVQHCRPTMVEVATQLKNMIRLTEGECLYKNLQGSKENFINNEAIVLEESISLFGDHRVKPVRYFSVNELNRMNVEILHCHSLHHGSWEGRAILVKLPESMHWDYDTSSDEIRSRLSREIVLATKMGFHDNVHKILGCCLETKFPVLVYEWIQTLEDRILHRDENKHKLPLLEWKDRLRIAWEISSHCFTCLHTVSHTPIIVNWEHHHVFLDQDNTPKLSISVFITEEEENDKMESHEVVMSFGVLILVLLTGKTSAFSSSGDGESTNLIDMINWVTKETTKDHISEILDPAITRIGVTKIEDHQMSASLELALLCTTAEVYLRPTMLEIATKLKNMIEYPESILTTRIFQGERICKIFRGSEENFRKNITMVLEESISFLGRVDTFRYFSVDDLNNMNVELSSNKMELELELDVWCHRPPLEVCKWNWYQGSWEGKAVLVKLSDGAITGYRTSANDILLNLSREILIATQMATHANVHKLLGCCLETEFPALVYEWMEITRLEDRILLKDENQNKLPVLEWKDRLRIAWEISQLLSYFYTAFHRPIVYQLSEFHMPAIFLDQDNTAKVSNFHHCCPIPAGEEKCEMAANVFCFGLLLISLLTGKSTNWIQANIIRCTNYGCSKVLIREIVDPVLDENVAATELSAAIELAIRCTKTVGDSTPTMGNVAAILYDIIESSESRQPGSGV